jgi:DNA-binding NarL/FixJ family response regulator
VLLAEDHDATLRSWQALLESEFEVVGSVGDGRALVAACDRLRPDVVVTDITMPAMSGIAAAEAILRSHPATRIVLVTVHAERVVQRKGLSAGALGYVLKIRAAEDLVPAVRAVVRGDVFLSPLPSREKN